MHHGRNISIRVLLGFHELHRIGEEFTDLLPALLFEEFRTGSDQNFHSGDAVLLDPATSIADNLIGYLPVFAPGDHGMEIVLAQFRLNIRIAGVGLFGSFVVRFDAAHSGALVFREPQNRMLCFTHQESPRFLQTIS